MCLQCVFVQIRQLCNVHYRKFEFARYPSHVRDLQTYAFKPIIIHVSLSHSVHMYACLCLLAYVLPLVAMLPLCRNVFLVFLDDLHQCSGKCLKLYMAMSASSQPPQIGCHTDYALK